VANTGTNHLRAYPIDQFTNLHSNPLHSLTYYFLPVLGKHPSVFSYLSTYMRDLFPTELVTKVKPNINSVEVHAQLSNKGRLVDGELVGAGSLWPLHDVSS
jgi:hypothetical protein